jgi:protoporphyrinogen oxidase
MISTIPLPTLIGLIENIPALVEKAASGLRATKLVLVNLALKRITDHGYHWMYFAEPKYPFFRVSFLHNYSDSMCPSGCGSMQAECAFPYNANVDIMEVAEHAKSQLSEAGYLDTRDLLFVKTRVVSPAYVICDHKRRENLRLILCYLHDHNVHCAGRFGAWEYINMDQCILAGRDAAEWACLNARVEMSKV